MNAYFIKYIGVLLVSLLSLPLLWATELAIPFVKQNGLILIEAEVNEKTGWFVFDSGADHVLINVVPDEKEDIVLFATLDGDAASSSILINSLKVGHIAKNDFEAYSADLSTIESFTGREIMGILNAGFFNPQSININLKEDKLYLYDDIDKTKLENFTHELAYTSDLGVPVVELILENQPYRFIVDTGATANLIDQELIDNLAHTTYVEDGFVDITTVGKKTKSQYITMKGWSAGPQEMGDQGFVVKRLDQLNEGLDKEERVVGLLSIESLSEVEVFIDLKGKKIYF